MCLLYVDSRTDWLTDGFLYCPSYKRSNSLILENSYLRAIITLYFSHRHLTKVMWSAVCSQLALDCRTRVLLVSFIMLKTKWKINPLSNVFTHVASTYANLMKKKKAFTQDWLNTNMAAVLLFWNTNMADATSYENAPHGAAATISRFF